MVNNGQDRAYLLDKTGIRRDDVDDIKKLFLGENLITDQYSQITRI